MTSSRGSESLPGSAMHVVAFIGIALLAGALLVMGPRADSAPEQVAQASQTADAPTPTRASEPPIETSGPTIATTEPPAATSVPAVATSAPAIRTVEPAVPSAEPAAGTTEPPAQTSEPAARSLPPVVETERPTQSIAPAPSVTVAPVETAPPRELTPQGIAFAPPRTLALRDDPADLRVGATSGLPVTVTAAGPCVIIGDRVRPTGVGTCILTARQAGDDTWAPALPVSRELLIEPARQSIVIDAPGAIAFGSDPVAVTARASSGLDVRLRAEGPCAIRDESELVATGAGICTLTATQDGSDDWAPADPVVRRLVIGKAPQSMEFQPLESMVFGSAPLEVVASASSGLPATISAEGPCVVEGGRVRATAAGTCVLTATQDGDDDWAAADPVVRHVVIGKAPQTIMFETPDALAYRDDPARFVATSSSGLPVSVRAEGACDVRADQVVATAAGTCTLTAAQAGNDEWAPADPVVRQVVIGKAPQTITFGPLDGIMFGATPVELDASADSGLPASILADGPCVLAGGRLRATGAGTCTLTASQDGNDDWAPANPVVRELVIAKALQSIEFGLPDALAYPADRDRISATASSGLPVAVGAEGACEVRAREIVATAAGTCTLTATQAGNDDWEAAEPVVHRVDIAKAPQSIDLRSMARTRFGAAPVSVSATSTSGLPVVLRADGPCVLESGRLRATGAGTCVLTARQDGNDDWAPADPVVRELVIEKAPQSIEFQPLESIVFGSEPVEILTRASSGLPVTISAEGPCRVEGGRLRATGAGPCVLTATQPGSGDWAPADPVVRELVIAKAPQSIEFQPPERIVFGSEPVEVLPSASSGLRVRIRAEGPCVLETGRLRATGAGTCVITVRQDGNDDWAPVDPVVRELVIAKAPQSITFEPPTRTRFGSAPLSVAATSTAGLPVVIQVDGPCVFEGGRVHATASGTCTLTATQPGNDDWAPADPVVRELVIEKARQSVSLEPLEGTVVGAAPRTLTASASSGLPVSFSASGPCEIADDEVRATGAGLCVITANQAGDERFAPADGVRRVFRIDRANQSISFPTLKDREAGDPPVELTARASSGLPVTYRTDGPCAVTDAGTLALNGPGTCTVIAVQPGDADHAPADEVSRSFEIVAPAREPSPEPPSTPGPSLADRDWPVPCATWQPLATIDAFAEGASDAVVCLEPPNGVWRYVLFGFEDGALLASRFSEHLIAARPVLGVSDEACRRNLPGAKQWEHGWVACWVPEDSTTAQLHWTDERTSTFGVLEADDERISPLYRRWYRAHHREAAGATDVPELEGGDELR